MKKKILLFAAIIVIAVSGMIPVVNALPSDDCPNGCLANGDGCWCYQWYPCYKEGPTGDVGDPGDSGDVGDPGDPGSGTD